MEKNLKSLLDSCEISQIIGDPTSVNINHVTQDSRDVSDKSLFVAIKRYNLDGHSFIEQAISSGAKAIICENLPNNPSDEVVWIIVRNSSPCLGKVASNFYNNPSKKLKIVGVTGTNGKTTIATSLFNLFQNMGYACGLLSSIDIRIRDKKYKTLFTTPLSEKLQYFLFKMVESGCTHCFMEVSSHGVHENRISGIDFNGAIFTNLTHDHLDYHGTFENYLNAKKQYFDELKPGTFALTNIDDKHAEVMIQNSDAKKYTFSVHGRADFEASVVEQSLKGMKLLIDGNKLVTPFFGEFNASNLLAVYSAAILLEEPKDKVVTALPLLKPIKGRLETIYSKSGKVAIIDFAHSPDALENTLKAVIEVSSRGEELITVVGCGGNRDKSKRPMTAKIASIYSNKVILTTDSPRYEDPDSIIADMKKGVPDQQSSKVMCITLREEAIRTALSNAPDLSVIVIAGKGHEDFQDFNGIRKPFIDREIVESVFHT